MILDLLSLAITVIVAIIIGKLLSKIKLPAIIGWLITGMVLGPHAIGVLDLSILDQGWYQIIMRIAECSFGIMIGAELIWNQIRKSGKQIFITTLTQSLGTFFLVSLLFGIVFHILDLPLYIAVIFGGIALATAPAPALSIVNEYGTDGPVTKMLIPMAALDNLLAVVVFFSVMALVSANVSAEKLPFYMILLVLALPIIIGIVVGLAAGFVLKNDRPDRETVLLLLSFVLIASGVGFFFDYLVLPKPVLIFMLIGIAFSATFANMVSKERLEKIMKAYHPVLGISIILAILNLGAPLDYHLILGAGLFTVIYILSRSLGKIGGAYIGGVITHSPPTVKKYLGFTLLPHSGVSLVFTGIAASVLMSSAPDSAKIIQGTIAATAVIYEIIAVLTSKQAFKWAGEMHKLPSGSA
ncbi:MAG: cation:proton antiporter [Syntrophomonadaceae bacterium]